MSVSPRVDTDVSSVVAGTRRRLVGIDRLRGLMVVLMVLDHVREYFHLGALTSLPTDLAQTTPALFATRWITHLCAPAFVFLAGASVYLQRAASPRLGPLAGFLALRGAWLIVLEITVISFAFNFAWPFLFLQVIWAIGAGFMLLAALLWLPPRLALALGVAIVAGHALLAPLQPAGAGAALWRLLMVPGPVPAVHVPGLLAYPLLPWFGILAVGYGLGGVFLLPDSARDRRIVAIAVGALMAFVVLRAGNLYGDPSPWAVQKDALFTAMSFINVSKYPPSLLFVLITLGVSLLLLPLLERLRGPAAAMLQVIGETPLFTYLLHIFLVHGAAMLVGMAMGIPSSAFVDFLGDPSRLVQADWGVSLGWVYVAWIAIVLALWPLAHWYAGLRRRHDWWWLRFL